LTSVTLPYLIEIADKGVEGAVQEDLVLAKGLSTLEGNLVSEPVAEAHDLRHEPLEKLLN
jgi:alanine dehydrogenase